MAQGTGPRACRNSLQAERCTALRGRYTLFSFLRLVRATTWCFEDGRCVRLHIAQLFEGRSLKEQNTNLPSGVRFKCMAPGTVTAISCFSSPKAKQGLSFLVSEGMLPRLLKRQLANACQENRCFRVQSSNTVFGLSCSCQRR